MYVPGNSQTETDDQLGIKVCVDQRKSASADSSAMNVYRMGFARLAEQSIRKARGKAEGERLGAMDRIAASSIGGALGCWNQPIEVSGSL